MLAAGARESRQTDDVFSGDLAALRPRLRSYAGSLTYDRGAAEDLVQETMLRAWTARDRFEPGTNLRAWLFTILRHLFLGSRRRDRFHGEYDEASADRRLATGENQTGIVDLKDVLTALDKLPLVQRESPELVASQGISYEEAAKITEAPLGTVKSRVGRARVALKDMIENPDVSAKPNEHKSLLRAKSSTIVYRELLEELKKIRQESYDRLTRYSSMRRLSTVFRLSLSIC